jgi:hypothetical protein
VCLLALWRLILSTDFPVSCWSHETSPPILHDAYQVHAKLGKLADGTVRCKNGDPYGLLIHSDCVRVEVHSVPSSLMRKLNSSYWLI